MSLQNVGTHLRWAATMVGHFGYSLIATFGIVGYSLWAGLEGLWRKRTGLFERAKRPVAAADRDPDTFTWALGLYSMAFLGVLALSSLFLTVNGKATSSDHVMYGRHTDSVMLPLLGIGFLTVWRLRKAVVISSGLLVAGIGFWFYEDLYSDLRTANMVNLVSLWPRLAGPEIDLFRWFLAGAVGVLAVALLVRLGKKPALLLLVPVLLLTTQAHSERHSGILAWRSEDPGLPAFIRGNYAKGECFGITPEIPENGVHLGGRARLLSYSAYRHDLEQIEIEEWFESCDGPYVTPYNLSLIHI